MCTTVYIFLDLGPLGSGLWIKKNSMAIPQCNVAAGLIEFRGGKKIIVAGGVPSKSLLTHQ